MNAVSGPPRRWPGNGRRRAGPVTGTVPSRPAPAPDSAAAPLSGWSCWRLLFWLLLATLLAGASAPARAATERWRGLSETLFRHYTASEVANANAMAQDGRGFIWVATQSGLTRWDGYRFRRYAAEQGKPGALPDALDECLFVDARGQLWIGTNSGGLVRYDPEHDNFIAVGGGPQGLSSQHISALAGDATGGLWVATSAGLDFVGPDGKVRHDADGGTAIGPLDSLLIEPNGVQWAGTRQALLRRENAASPCRTGASGCRWSAAGSRSMIRCWAGSAACRSMPGPAPSACRRGG